MREIIKVMLQEGIDEETIHECLDIIQETSDEKANRALEAAQARKNRDVYNAGVELYQASQEGNKEGAKKAEQKMGQASDKFNKHLNLQAKRARRLGKSLVQDPKDHDSFQIK